MLVAREPLDLLPRDTGKREVVPLASDREADPVTRAALLDRAGYDRRRLGSAN